MATTTSDSFYSTDSSPNSEIIETLKLLEEGKRKIVLSEKYKDVTLVLGITGAGKTTFVQWLAGDDSKLIAVKEEGSRKDFIIQDGDRIGNSTIESKTVFPELVVESKSDTPYYDCPGFIDSRGIGNDITSTYFIKVVADFAKSVKLIFAIDYPSVRKTGNRDTFTNLLKHSTQVIKNVDKFRGGIALVATKVPNEFVENDDGGIERVSDEDMIRPIAFFLRDVKNDLAKLSNSKEDENLIKFIDAVLQMDGQQYPKIGLFRKPNKAGPLNEIPLLIEGKKKIVEMVNKLEYTQVEADDFGYTISDRSKNNINGLMEEINSRVWNELDSAVKKIRKFYDETVGEMSGKIKSFENNEDVVEANVLEAQTFAVILNSGYQLMSELIKEVTITNSTIKQFHEKLNSTLSDLKLNDLCQDNLATIANQTSYADFLEKVSESPLTSRPWASLLKPIVDLLSFSKQNIQTDVKSVGNTLKVAINTAVKNEIANKIWQDKVRKMKSSDIQLLPAKLDQDYAVMRNMTLELTSAENAEQLANAINKNVDLLLDSTSEIKQKTLNIFNQAKYLNFLQALSDESFTIWSPDWAVPLTETTKSLFVASNWYQFLNGLYSKLGEYQFQQNTAKFNVANLDDWGSGQTKQQDIQINEKNLNKFLNIVNQFKISGYDALKDAQLAQWQLDELNQMLRLTLKHSKSSVDCSSEKGKLVVTGDYVKFSELKQKLVEMCPEDNVPSSVDIFATNRVFIDSDLNGLGAKLKLTVMAPKWEVIGQRAINLDGSPAAKHEVLKAKNATQPGNSGDNGKPGYTGGSSGGFLGIGNQIVNVEALTISANGGNGSGGQAGGDGKPGDDGKDAVKPTSQCDITGKYDVIKSETGNIWTGSSFVSVTTTEYLIKGTEAIGGGSGGHGGAGGLGGKCGKINSLSLMDKKNNQMQVKSITEDGDKGANGKGGLGKVGGKNGNNMKADCVFGRIRQLSRANVVKVDTKASSGRNGTEGGSPVKPDDPESAATIEHPAQQVNAYKMYLRDNLDDESGRFKRSPIIELIDQLDGDERVRGSYDTLALADEFQGLEEQFRTLKNNKINKKDLIHFYESLVNRIEAYVKSPKPTEKTSQYKKMFNYLYAATLGKLHNLKSGSETNLIIDVEGYLSYVEDNVKILDQLRKAQNQHVIVQEEKRKYSENIDAQIKEAKQFIDTQVTPEFERISVKIDEQIEKLVKEVVELEKEEVKNKEKMEETQKKLQNQLIWKGVFGSIKIVNQVSSFFGPPGMAIGAAVSASVSLGEALALGDDVKFELPDEIKEIKSLLETELKSFNEDNEKELEAKIAGIKKELKPELGLKDLDAKLDKILIKVRKNYRPEAIAEANEELKKTLDEKEKELKDSKDSSKEAMDAVKTAKNIFNVGSKVWETLKGDAEKMKATENALVKIEESLRKLDLAKKNIYTKISPSMKQLEDYLNGVQSKLNGATSQVALDVTNWQVQGMVRDVKLEMRQATKGMQVEDDLARCIDKLEEAMTVMIKIYDRIQALQQQQQLANFIANINSVESNKINITDTKLSSAVNKLDIVIRSNVVLQQYDSVVGALKQTVFPYARHYLESLKLPSQINFNQTDIDTLVTSASATLNKMKLKLVENKTTISKVDRNTQSFEFDSTKPCIQAPFYVWSSNKFSNELSKLLSGESVTLKADIRQSDREKDAIKFLNVNLNFKAKNALLQPEIDAKLEKFIISATHMGNSYYRYGGKYYLINHESLDIEYSFAKRSNGYPIQSSRVYDKIQNGTLTLSPYGMWKIQLDKMNRTVSFDQLLQYKDEVNLELVGPGIFIKTKDALNNELQLDQFYNEQMLDDVQTETETDLVQQNAQMYGSALKRVKCRKQQYLISNATEQPLSYISRLRRAVSNYFGTSLTPSSNHIMAHPRIEYTKQQQHQTTNLTQTSTPLDVQGNLLMGQLFVGLITGKNKTLTSESYISPQQTINVQAERLAHKVLPHLGKQNQYRSNQIHNSNNQWHRELFSDQNDD